MPQKTWKEETNEIAIEEIKNLQAVLIKRFAPLINKHDKSTMPHPEKTAQEIIHAAIAAVEER